ncbi:hypothetical protein [Streptomyces sp. NPDC048419]|uniref:hypothetical protein n=1 Tax=Streptomyces sp. NPDC048419 TaxID=3365547 RepID=UPI003714C9F5
MLELQPLPLPEPRYMALRKLPADLPVGPVGTLELHGRADESPLGVPWIEGRAYWPKRSYSSADLKRPQAGAVMTVLLNEAGNEEPIVP